ncbi:hypothetical protein [Gimesia sp.]|uniref:hypothetical protein n=1 Tax=Gimesia sp. TaxID=2024833 RepID=UPI003A8F802C
MNHSLRISSPPERDWYSDDTKKALVPLVKEITKHNDNVKTHEELRSKAESEDIENLTSKDLFDGQVSAAYRFDLYKKAIELCDKVKEFNDLHVADHRARHQEIVEERTGWSARIREELTKLGYVEEALHREHVHQVNNFYRMHPEVVKLNHLEGQFRHPDYLKGGDRSELVAGMANLRKRCLLA